jgi:glutaminyl-tRNA synthetase
VKGTIHWVSASHAIEADLRLYDRLFTEADPDADGRDFKKVINQKSLRTVRAWLEPSLANATPEERYQFERGAYYTLDKDSKPEHLIFNRIITLKDTWAKEAKKS